MEMTSPIEFMQYDKISDDVYQLDRNFIIRFNVSLSKLSPNDNSRRFFHSEYKYPSRGKGAYDSLITVRRSFDYFLTLENIFKDENGNKEYIIIGPGKFMLFKYALKEALSWFTSKEYGNLYAYKDDRLIITAPIPSYEIKGLTQDKRIVFRPCVLVYGDGERESGIEIDISSSGIIKMSLDKFMGMYYILYDFNMFTSAQMMLAYLGGREPGTNMMDFGNNKSSYISSRQFVQEPDKTECSRRRRVGDKNLSIKDLE